MTKKLDKSSPSPLYLQLAEIIETAIRSGLYPQGSKIPTEQELMETYSVSRVTVRQTMQHLITKGIIVRKQGIGTFVNSRVISQNMDDFLSFYLSLLNKGSKLDIRILTYEIISPDSEVQDCLQLYNQETVLKFVRQFLIEETLSVIDEVYVPFEIAKHWSREEALHKGSIQLIQEKVGIKLNNSVLKIRASFATSEMSDLLKIMKGSPVLELRRLTYSTAQRPVDYTIFYFPGYSFELTAKLLVGDQQILQLRKK